MNLSDQDLVAFQSMDAADRLPAEATQPMHSAAALPGRISGSADWVASRGEDGRVAGTGMEDGSSEQPVGTRYVLAHDEHLRHDTTESVDANDNKNSNSARIVGGAVRASGENLPGEGTVKAFDGQVGTKWLDFSGGRKGVTPWIEYRLRAGQEPIVLQRYSMTSANDAPERDPTSFVLQAIDADGREWGLLESTLG